MKALTFIATIAILSAPSFHCCKKYEDGSAFSLKSRKERLANTWKVKSCTVNGNDSTSSYPDYNETFSRDGNYCCSKGNSSCRGTWTFAYGDSQVKLTMEGGGPSPMLIITKLEENELWYYFYEGGVEKKFRMIPD